ncbi:hypothetical protein AHF37_05859 [Paragonimus kellicotti]|nr:hypothetical protein AHF37_05859 [Paragonimus kellicotti]
MLEKKDKENENVREKTSEGAHFLKQIAQRIGISEMNASYDHVFNKLLEKLDRTALLELQYAQNETQLTKTLKELDIIKTSGNELTKRNEQFLNEKKVLNEKIASMDAQLTDVQSQFQLAQTSMKAKDKQLQDLHKQLHELTAANEKEKKNAEDFRFKGDVAKMQLKSMLDSLAASLTTIEHPCASTEVGVKEAVLRLLDQLKCMKENGMMFQQRVADLQAQFESQFKTGKAINEELDQARRRVREAETDKSKLETEVLGLRLLVQNEHGDQKNTANLVRRLCERLGLDPGDDGLAANSTLLTMIMDSIEHLLSHGCLLQSCLIPKLRSTRCDHHVHVDHIPSKYHSHSLEPTRPSSVESMRATFCDHCGTHELLEVIWRGDGKLSEANQARMRELCPRCLQQLVLAASEQLHRARITTQLTPRLKLTHSDQNELLAKLQLELEQEQTHVRHLTDSLAKAEAKTANLVRRLCERLGLDPGDDGLAANSTLLTMIMDSIEHLLSHGCLLQSCLIPKLRSTRCDHHVHVDHIPSKYHSHSLEPTRPSSVESMRATFCDHCGTHELLEVIWRGDGKLSEANQARMRELCPRCLQQLVLAASEQLHRARITTQLTPD